METLINAVCIFAVIARALARGNLTKRESDVSVPICGIPTVAKSLPRNDIIINQYLLRSEELMETFSRFGSIYEQKE